MHIEQTIIQALKTALYNAFGLEKTIQTEKPKDSAHGDFSSNIAMLCARDLRQNPYDIATKIVGHLPEIKGVKTVDIKRPGFINFYIETDALKTVIPTILDQGRDYGSLTTGQGTHINIEFVSVNPTGDIHVGHARGAAAGDTMSRILKKAGYQVTKEYYVNDGGNQIHNLALSIQARYEQLFGKDAHLPEDGYHGKEITALAQAIKDEYGEKYLYEDGYDFFKTDGVQKMLAGIKSDLDRFDVAFDIFFSEKSLYEKGTVEATIDTLKSRGHTYEQDGALWLKTSDFGDEKDRVIIKSDGTYTYLTPDIAYHQDKLNRGYDLLVDILGGDHHGYINRLKAAIAMLTGKSDQLEIDILQMVKVLQDGEEVKMSKRSGKAITLRDLIDEAGKDAIRYFFARHSLNTHMDLDLDLAIKKSNDNPVFYAQYAHARIVTLLNKAQDTRALTPEPSLTNYDALNNDHVKALLSVLNDYPSVIEEAASKRIFHKVTQYIHTLAQHLHSYYSHVPVIVEDDQATVQALNLLMATKTVLKDALDLIGVDAPNSM